MDKGALSSRGGEFSGTVIYDGHLVPEAKEQNMDYFIFKYRWSLKENQRG